MQILFINHTKKHYHTIEQADNIKYISLEHNKSDEKIEIHINTNGNIPNGYRLHTPMLFKMNRQEY